VILEIRRTSAVDNVPVESFDFNEVWLREETENPRPYATFVFLLERVADGLQRTIPNATPPGRTIYPKEKRNMAISDDQHTKEGRPEKRQRLLSPPSSTTAVPVAEDGPGAESDDSLMGSWESDESENELEDEDDQNKNILKSGQTDDKRTQNETNTHQRDSSDEGDDDHGGKGVKPGVGQETVGVPDGSRRNQLTESSQANASGVDSSSLDSQNLCEDLDDCELLAKLDADLEVLNQSHRYSLL
jgi:hypothetical protein